MKVILARSHATDFFCINGATCDSVLHIYIYYRSVRYLKKLTPAVKSNQMSEFKRLNQHLIGHLIAVPLFTNLTKKFGRFDTQRKRVDAGFVVNYSLKMIVIVCKMQFL